MSHDYNNPAFKNLLQKLQEESWQLELLISGFAIFGLFTAYDPIDIARIEARNTEQVFNFSILMLVQISCVILIVNLILHVLLRALWIGALGLRYVSGDIDYEYLNYSEKFTKYLKQKVGSFDRYISQLETYCSIIFAISFLLIFYVIAFMLTIVSIPLIAEFLLNNNDIPDWLGKGLGIPLIIFIVIGMLLTVIDFLTQGFLKKKKWLSKIYFPFYWIFSFLTLSFLYRPIVYNFLDNKFGRRLSMLLIPLAFIFFFGLSLKFNRSNYFNIYNPSNEITANNSNYENLLDDKVDYIYDVAIQSKTITDPFVKVFVLYSEDIEDRIFEENIGIKPDTDIRGYTSNINFSSTFIDGKERDSLRKEYIKTFNHVYAVKIDSQVKESAFIMGRSKSGKLGFETYIDTDSLANGKHVLEFFRKLKNGKKATTDAIATIPFWYFKDRY